ncbi:hypothetical protein GCM10011575_19900 [Microlunatus endophyticus]|uniref:Uncharacterized protein n=1 Tax=Microlunatus endophyticus TaxID=1716077 RepID=A0A917W2H8_9ACTN|nr:hypothetical protein [Microlunatus endophyticus]GGL61393.1 hypothetical protein GCM10011575_19900 [Microlunatus endophyticus]
MSTVTLTANNFEQTILEPAEDSSAALEDLIGQLRALDVKQAVGAGQGSGR